MLHIKFPCCSSDFPIAVIRSHGQSDLQRKTFIWGLQFKRVRVHSYHGGLDTPYGHMSAGGQAWWWNKNKELTS